MRQKPRQMGLFEQQHFAVEHAVKAAMRDAVEASGMSREQIVDAMNALAARHGVRLTSGNGGLTPATFEKWLNPHEGGRRISIVALPVFCSVTGDFSALAALAAPLGLAVMDEEEQRLVQYARATIRAKRAKAELRRLEGELG